MMPPVVTLQPSPCAARIASSASSQGRSRISMPRTDSDATAAFGTIDTSANSENPAITSSTLALS